jgi:hypothetical protein
MSANAFHGVMPIEVVSRRVIHPVLGIEPRVLR